MPPRSTPTATRTEGLSAAYELARDFGSDEEADEILEAVVLGLRYQMSTQFAPPSAMYLPNPARCLGGVRRSLTSFEIRIDYVQHHLSAALGYWRILKQQGQNAAD